MSKVKGIILGIDPGHPSFPGDQGCIHGDIVESEYTWQLANLWAETIKNLPLLPVQPVILRSAIDEVLPLAERGKRAREAGCDLVASIHVNAFRNELLRGARSFYWPGNKTGWCLAESWLRSVPAELYWPRAPISTEIRNSQDEWLEDARAVVGAYSCTTVLLEVGFASNPQDNAALQKNSVQAGLVWALMAMLSRYQRIMEQRDGV